MHVSSKLGLLYIVTKFGFLFVYEMTTALCIVRTRVSNDVVFIGTRNSVTDGVMCINKAGVVLACDVDETLLVGHIVAQFP